MRLQGAFTSRRKTHYQEALINEKESEQESGGNNAGLPNTCSLPGSQTIASVVSVTLQVYHT